MTMSDTQTTDCKSNQIVTIEDAIARYRDQYEDAAGFRELVALVIGNGLTTPFQNDNYADALNLTEMMLKGTNLHINIVTGCGCGNFYATLLDHLTETLVRIRQNGGHAKMIVVADKCPRWLEVLSQEFMGTFEIALKQSSEPLQHFIVCDSKIVRLEKIHQKLRPDSSAQEIKAEVHFNNPAKGKELEGSFETLWADTVKCVSESRKSSAPSWLIQRMEASRQRPSPTSATMERQFRAVEAARQNY